MALTLNTQKERLGCEIYIRDDSKLFHNLISKKDIIETQIGESLEWLELPEATASRILLLKDGDPKNRKNWDEYFEWFCSKADVFYNAFKPYL